jgi:hypothetical protein
MHIVQSNRVRENCLCSKGLHVVSRGRLMLVNACKAASLSSKCHSRCLPYRHSIMCLSVRSADLVTRPPTEIA